MIIIHDQTLPLKLILVFALSSIYKLIIIKCFCINMGHSLVAWLHQLPSRTQILFIPPYTTYITTNSKFPDIRKVNTKVCLRLGLLGKTSSMEFLSSLSALFANDMINNLNKIRRQIIMLSKIWIIKNQIYTFQNCVMN